MAKAVSPYTEAIASKGAASRESIYRLVAADEEFDGLLVPEGDDAFRELDDALRAWDDADVAAVIESIIDELSKRHPVPVLDVTTWIAAHNCDGPKLRAEHVRKCLACHPPEGFRVKSVLSDAGHQKIVYEAISDIGNRCVALKKLVGAGSEQQISSELFAHRLSVQHPNIIETFPYSNAENESFFVEEMLQDIIDEETKLGSAEIANLLRDILNALTYLEDRRHVHGDIKPGNLGRSHGLYLLLDFGTSQPLDRAINAKPSGSLRTRAPELLIDKKGQGFTSDVWALGASAYRLLCGRFPLMETADVWPARDDVAGRLRFEETLTSRAKTEYERLVDLSLVEAPLRALLGAMLARDPASRPTAHKLRMACDQTLGAYLRVSGASFTLSPIEELLRLYRHLDDPESLARMSYDDQRSIHATLQRIEQSPAFAEIHKEKVNELRRRLPPEAQ